MNTLIIVKIKNTTYDEWKKKFDSDAEVQSEMMRNTIVGKVDDETAMITNPATSMAQYGRWPEWWCGRRTLLRTSQYAT